MWSVRCTRYAQAYIYLADISGSVLRQLYCDCMRLLRHRVAKRPLGCVTLYTKKSLKPGTNNKFRKSAGAWLWDASWVNAASIIKPSLFSGAEASREWKTDTTFGEPLYVNASGKTYLFYIEAMCFVLFLFFTINMKPVACDLFYNICITLHDHLFTLNHLSIFLLDCVASWKYIGKMELIHRI